MSGLVSAGARWGSVHKDLARAVGSLLDLVVGVAVLHIELYALEKVMHATASAGYVAFWVYFWMEFFAVISGSVSCEGVISSVL